MLTEREIKESNQAFREIGGLKGGVAWRRGKNTQYNFLEPCTCATVVIQAARIDASQSNGNFNPEYRDEN